MTVSATTDKMNLSRFGEDGIRILFGESIDLEVHEKVRNFYFYMKSLDLREIIDLTPSFRSCLLHFDTERTSFARLSSLLMEKEDGRAPSRPHAGARPSGDSRSLRRPGRPGYGKSSASRPGWRSVM